MTKRAWWYIVGTCLGMLFVTWLTLAMSSAHVGGARECVCDGVSMRAVPEHTYAIMAERARAARAHLDELHCRVHGIASTGGFCLLNTTRAGGNEVWDAPVCRALNALFDGASVGDFGAGLGHYGACLRNWEGWDGAAGVEAATDGRVRFLDLTERPLAAPVYEWVLSLEVGEHIPAQHMAAYLDNVVAHARRGVVLSWAVPGQGGHHHVNELSNDRVITELWRRGMAYDDVVSTRLRSAARLPWFKDTLMVFRRP